MYEKKTMASQWLKQRQKEQGFLTDVDFHAASVMEKEHLIGTYNTARNAESSTGSLYYRTAPQFFNEFFNSPFKSA